MDRSIALLVAIVCVIAILNALGAGNLFGPPRPVAKRFLTPRETAMLAALERALPHCRIHAQVAMGALLQVPNNPLRKRKLSDRNAFSQKIADFVAQDRATGAVLALIKVDNRSHHAGSDRVHNEITGYAGHSPGRKRHLRRCLYRLSKSRIAGPLRPYWAAFRRSLKPLRSARSA